MWSSLASMHRDVSGRKGRQPALRYKHEGAYRDLSWADYRRAADETAGGLLALGIERGDRVAILSENRREWLVADCAVLSIGAVTVSIHSPLSARQVAYQVEHSGARGIFVSNQDQAAKVFDVLDQLPALEFLVSFDPVEARSGVVCKRFAELKLGDRSVGDIVDRERALTRDDLAAILYTSGTTGNPKGVMLSHGNILSNVEATLAAQRREPSDVLLSWLPYSHIYARTVDHYLTTMSESILAMAESFETLIDDIAAVQPTWLTGVPRFYEKVWTAVEHLPEAERKAELHRLFGSRIKFLSAGGAPLPRHVGEGFEAAGIPLLQGYGLTESSPVISSNVIGENRVGTVGRPLPGVEVRIADDGEILSRGPHIMKGYWRDDAETEKTIVDGWLHTGDVGELDDDGYLTITDRKKDLIITSGGVNVTPSLLEHLLTSDRFIDQAVVYGDGRKFVSALIVPDFAAVREDHDFEIESTDGFVTTPELIELIDRRVAEIMEAVSQPERVKKCLLLDRPFTLEADEMTPTLKVRRRYLTTKYAAQLDALYEG